MNDCVFCKIINNELPANKIYEDEKIIAFLDIDPINKGHALLVPKQHYSSTLETPDQVVCNLAIMAKKIAKAIMRATGAHACNIGINNGKESGQVVFHTHWHIMPRFENDGYELWKGKDTTYVDGEAAQVAAKIKNNL